MACRGFTVLMILPKAWGEVWPWVESQSATAGAWLYHSAICCGVWKHSWTATSAPLAYSTYHLLGALSPPITTL
jgi:hypothetical protein